MGKGSQTLGYHYIMTLVMHLCRGPVDEIIGIEVGDESAWRGNVSDDTPTALDAPDLFGGTSREGGIQGAFRLLQGADDQVLPGASSEITVGSSGPVQSASVPDIKALIGQRMGELRGVCSVVFDGLVTSLSPYPKEWRFRLRRSQSGWYGGTPWYGAKATICVTGDGTYSDGDGSDESTPDASQVFTSTAGTLIGSDYDDLIVAAALANGSDAQIKGMNGAHIIYQAMTDPLWGAGRRPEDIDENSFIAAANTLCAEKFALCLLWAREEDVDSFIQSVADLIAAAIYIDPQSGKWTIRLIRDDYNIEDLPVYGFESGLLSIEEEDNASNVDSFNEVRIVGLDPVSNSKFEVWAQSLAALQDPEASVISQQIEFKGIPTRGLALRVAERELRPYAAGLKRYNLRFDQRAWAMTPAMPFRVVVPGLDIVLRAVKPDYGTPDNPEVGVSAMEDVFAFSETSFGEIAAGNAPPVPGYAFPSPRTLLVEAGYRDLYRTIGTTEAQAAADTAAFIGQFALAPTAKSLEYRLASKAAGEPAYLYANEQPFTPWANLAEPVGPLDTEMQFDLNSGIGSDQVGEALHIGGPDGEVVRLDSYTGGIATVSRGCADTVPQSHPANSDVWPLDDTHGIDGREYALGEDVTTLVLTRTSTALLSEDNAVPETLGLAGRHALPFPPAQVSVGGDEALISTMLHSEPVITWVARDRLAQADALVSYDEAGVGPEPGTTYRARVYDESDLLAPLRTETGITSPWTYSGAMQTADGDPVRVIVRLDAQRDGLDSWQAQEFAVNLSGGYGQAYGMDYGGA